MKANGTWNARRGLTGVKLGGFSIITTVSQPRPHAESRIRISGTLQGELRAGVVLERATRTAAGEALDAGGYAVVGSENRGSENRGQVSQKAVVEGS